MSSSQPFVTSSPSSGGHRKKSKFTFKNLAQLALSAPSCPLRVIAHVDLDAFYAQCETVRLGLPEDQPLAVQQWQGLIAINYPSRKFGLARHIDIKEAKKRMDIFVCPNLICQHVATWREGDEKWAYHENASENIATHKVSLDPYRLESRKILACIKETLPEKLQRVEKAGIDEVFLDLCAQIHSILVERYPELALPAPYDDPTEYLPFPPTTALDWQADALIDLDTNETEEDDPDWDDIVILIGSEIVRDVRAAVYKKLKYTCSGGVAQNRMLSKLGSAHKKPNQQTVIRNRAIQHFLSGFKYSKIRGLGGKLGEEVQAAFKTDNVEDVLLIPIEKLKQKLGEELGTWFYNIIRGIDSSEVSTRTQLKSMLSAKSFRPSINAPEQAIRWLRIFAADLFSRLVDEGLLENKRRPKTIFLHHRHGGQTKARSGQIAQGKMLDEATLFELAKNLLGQIIEEGKVWPCANLSLSISGFEDGVTGNRDIGSFLITGDEAKALNVTPRDSPLTVPERQPQKRRRLGNPGIQRFFVKTESTAVHEEDSMGAQPLRTGATTANGGDADLDGLRQAAAMDLRSYNEATSHSETGNVTVGSPVLHQQQISGYLCNRCGRPHASADALQSHEDWHFAKDLQDEDKQRSAPPMSAIPVVGNKTVGPSSSRKVGGRIKPEKGQSKLAFG